MRETAEQCANRVVREEILEELLRIDQVILEAKAAIILKEMEDAATG